MKQAYIVCIHCYNLSESNRHAKALSSTCDEYTDTGKQNSFIYNSYLKVFIPLSSLSFSVFVVVSMFSSSDVWGNEGPVSVDSVATYQHTLPLAHPPRQ